MNCGYCQNYDISQYGKGNIVMPKELADIMLNLQNKNCHNINLVSPTHVTFQIVEALILAIKKGLNVPILYNTNSYDSLKVLKLINNVIDIYLPDLRYMSNFKAKKYLKIDNYADTAKKSVEEMYKQVQNLKYNEKNIAIKGILVRLLILPNKISDTIKAIDFLYGISENISVNIMKQYYPAYKAKEFSELKKLINSKIYDSLIEYVQNNELNII